MATPIYIAEDHAITLTGLNVEGSYLNAATVIYTLKTAKGATVTGGTGSLSYESSSDGNYSGTIQSTVTMLLKDGGSYFLDVVIVETPYDGRRRLPLIAAYRGAT